MSEKMKRYTIETVPMQAHITKPYEYSRNNVTAKITNHNGAWKLNISAPNRVIVLFNDTYPTKRAALKYASIVLKSFN